MIIAIFYYYYFILHILHFLSPIWCIFSLLNPYLRNFFLLFVKSKPNQEVTGASWWRTQEGDLFLDAINCWMRVWGVLRAGCPAPESSLIKEGREVVYSKWERAVLAVANFTLRCPPPFLCSIYDRIINFDLKTWTLFKYHSRDSRAEGMLRTGFGFCIFCGWLGDPTGDHRVTVGENAPFSRGWWLATLLVMSPQIATSIPEAKSQEILDKD